MANTIATLDELREKLREVFEHDPVDVDHVTHLMESYKTNRDDWKQFAKSDRYKYTRNLVDDGNGKYNLMLLCWGEGHASPIHDHSDSHCFMKMLDGELREVRYEWPKEGESTMTDSVAGEQLQEKSSTLLKLNSVCYMNDSLGLHRVGNPSHVYPAVSLHLYSPPFSTCQMFDLRTGKKAEAKMTFWSKFGEKLPPVMAPGSCVPVDSSDDTKGAK